MQRVDQIRKCYRAILTCADCQPTNKARGNSRDKNAQLQPVQSRDYATHYQFSRATSAESWHGTPAPSRTFNCSPLSIFMPSKDAKVSSKQHRQL